ncbi:sensor histidine kinase [Wukongibacter sp. M2B1]|uniref:sensor histidine kinase n=1 Tax=Wukongibacter sp. M2B1 TaxID=3088895 RepID=UPI003D79E0F9
MSKKDICIEKLHKNIEKQFLRHQDDLNVIAGLIQLKKYDEALEYLKERANANCRTYSLISIKNLELAILLENKLAQSENKGINFEIDIRSSLEKVNMKPQNLCIIVRELIENAIFELDNCSESERLLTVDICEYANEYAFTIVNSHPILSSELYEKIFESGYTTKSGNGHGHGLSTVKKIVLHNKGRINVESYEGVGTIFTVFLSKKKN